ncbi:MAG: response regulator transcription factor [Acidobacteriaceae bacterium]
MDDVRIVSQCAGSEQLSHAILTLRSSIIIFASSLGKEMQEIMQAARASSSKLVVLAECTESLHTYTDNDVDGVIFRDIEPADLNDCVRRVAAGGKYFQQKPGRSLTDEADMVGIRVLARLTPKQIQVIACILNGYQNKDIAKQLGTSEQVIKNHLNVIYDKTGVSDRLGLALFTIHHRTLAIAVAAVGVRMGI